MVIKLYFNIIFIKTAKFFNIPFIETSAKETINTNELFGLTIGTFLNKTNVTGRRTIDNSRRNNSHIIDVNKDVTSKDSNRCCLK